MTSLPGQYTGWHHYCYPADKYICTGIASDCANAPCSRPTNFFLCKSCTHRQWFLSKIHSFNSDDISRAEAQRRINLIDPIKVHTNMRKVHAEFRARGGIIRILGNPRDLPTVCWSDSGLVVKSVTYPLHIRSDCLSI